MPDSLVKGYLGYADVRGPARDLVFQYNPQPVKRARRATYAKNTASRADFPNSNKSAVPAAEWIRNESEDFSIELLFHRDGKDDVETELKMLDEFMRPDPNTGEPRDLVIVLGPRSDRVRILEKSVDERLFSPSLKVQEAAVQLKFQTMRSRSA